MIDREARRLILVNYGASGSVVDELLEYTNNDFLLPETIETPDDEPFVNAWRGYLEEARLNGAFSCLRTRVVQFAFPIERGISKTEAYIAATRKGELVSDGPGLKLESPETLRIDIHPTAAGAIPLLITSRRQDFVTLVQALIRRNEPVPVPDSMGACMVSGYNNWDRIRSYKREWEQSHPDEPWDREFPRLASRKELYQDRFILLSDGPYSGVIADEMGMPEDVWRPVSLIIRREHECAHYFTRRMLGSMRNNLLDELMADFAGIVAVAGRFRADWFLRFMGLEDFPIYRASGRFQNYTQGMTEGARRVLQRLIVDAARNIEELSIPSPHSTGAQNEAHHLLYLATFTLEELAAGSMNEISKNSMISRL